MWREGEKNEKGRIGIINWKVVSVSKRKGAQEEKKKQ